MRRYYMSLTQSVPNRRRRQHRREAVVFIVSRIAFRYHGASAMISDRLWYQVYRGPWRDDGPLMRWQQYASVLARTWNATLLAAEVLGVSLECPPKIMADALDDLGEAGLAELLRSAYAPDCYGEPEPGPCDRMPGIPTGAPDHSCIIV